MSDADALASLLERVCAAKGPDQILNGLICRALDPDTWEKCCWWASTPSGAPLSTVLADAPKFAPNYTASLDAALALAERVGQPYTEIILIRYPRDEEYAWEAEIETFTPRVSGSRKWNSAEAPTPALALIAALLRSLEA